MTKKKKLRNLKIFAPKRQYNKPRNSTAVAPREEVYINLGFEVRIRNTTKKWIYVRAE